MEPSTSASLNSTPSQLFNQLPDDLWALVLSKFVWNGAWAAGQGAPVLEARCREGAVGAATAAGTDAQQAPPATQLDPWIEELHSYLFGSQSWPRRCRPHSDEPVPATHL